MEEKLDNVLDTLMEQDKVIGALFTDCMGLSYGSELSWFICVFVYKCLIHVNPGRGVASEAHASGYIASIAENVSKLHPNLNAPVVFLESSDKWVWTLLMSSFITHLSSHSKQRTLNFQARELRRRHLQAKDKQEMSNAHPIKSLINW